MIVFVSVLLLSSHQSLAFLRNRAVRGVRIARLRSIFVINFTFFSCHIIGGNFSTFLFFFGSCRRRRTSYGDVNLATVAKNGTRCRSRNANRIARALTMYSVSFSIHIIEGD